jgi:hypothetical protein
MKKLDPKLPIWQARIVRTVDKIVEQNLVSWGHQYATFLDTQKRRIEAAVGVGPILTPNLRRKMLERNRTVIEHVVRAHPTWTREEIAHTVGLSIPTIDRHLRALRKQSDAQGEAHD